MRSSSWKLGHKIALSAFLTLTAWNVIVNGDQPLKQHGVIPSSPNISSWQFLKESNLKIQRIEALKGSTSSRNFANEFINEQGSWATLSVRKHLRYRNKSNYANLQCCCVSNWIRFICIIIVHCHCHVKHSRRRVCKGWSSFIFSSHCQHIINR